MARQNQTVRIDIEASGIEKFERQVEQLYQKLQRRSREAGMSQREMGGYIDRALRNQDELAQRDLINQRDNLRRSIDEGRMSRTKASQLWDQARRTYETETAIRREVRKRNERDTDRRREEREYRLDEMTRSSWRDVRTKARNWQGVDSQINAIERARAAEIKREESRIDKAEKKGEINSKEAERLRKENRDDAQFNREMLQKLREIAQNTKDSARKSGEELAKRLNIKDKQQADEAIQSLMRPTGDIAKDSRRKEAANVIREQWSGRQSLADVAGMLMRGGGLSGLLSRLGGPLALIGAVGGATRLAIGAFNNYQDRWEQARDVALGYGTEVKPLMETMRNARSGFAPLGLEDKGVYKLMGSQSAALGRPVSTIEAIQNYMRSRLQGISDDEFNSIARLSKYTTGNASGIAATANLISNERYGNNFRTSEILDTFQQVANQMLSVTGRANSEAILGTMTRLMGAGMSGQQLNRTMSSLQSVGQTGSPAARALLQKAAAEYLGPDANMWEITKLIENPMANPEFLNNYIKMLDRGGGGGMGTNFVLKQALPGNLSTDDIDKLLRAQRRGGVAGLRAATNDYSDFSNESYINMYSEYVGDREKINALFQALKNNVTDEAASFVGKAGRSAGKQMDTAIKVQAQGMEKLLDKETFLRGVLDLIGATEMMKPANITAKAAYDATKSEVEFNTLYN